MKNKIRVAPSILAADILRFGDEIRALDAAGADEIHVDIMDGCFVPNITFGVSAVRMFRTCTNLPLDVHLMIVRPERYIGAFAEAGADTITVHVEATDHLHKVVQEIKKNGRKAGVSLNPATSLSVLDYLLPDVDLVLLMSVNPGFGGQSFLPLTLKKIRDLRAAAPGIDIEVDGGIAETEAAQCAKAGANVFVAGTYIFGGDYAERIKKLREVAERTAAAPGSDG
ncbi:MAG: ribulose-phosphate 3-epimerase [Fusobacteriaceae bacterium]|jgi:ribulose-phosphate 3-epimerase|nr:ribulose-phosphate 3-epimerase [Fusobacteriaceae bacterium]